MIRHVIILTFLAIPILSGAQHLSIKTQGEKFALFSDSSQVTEYIYTEVAYQRQGAIWVNKGDLYGYIDSSGKEITEFIYDEVSGFYDGRARVARDSMYGFINESGNEVIGIQYRNATLFREGIASAEKDSGQWILIDTNGHQVGNFILDHPAHYENGNFICICSNGKWGVINNNGVMIQDFRFDLIRPNGTAWLNDKKYWLSGQ